MTLILVFLACLGLAGPSAAHDLEDEDIDTLPMVTIEGERPVAASSDRIIVDQDLVLQPQGRPADLLRLAPGLITIEHSGGAGKADQFLLRWV